ncbi:hypothetical protein B0H11DRAFT_2278279 [Mycena galericulata]|nr:hypothetical protein B0H11DRAFT_2278279 [Mycena galericulata]
MRAPRLLLRHMSWKLSWNKECLIEKYMDNANKILVAAGAAVPEAPRPNRRKPKPASLRAPAHRHLPPEVLCRCLHRHSPARSPNFIRSPSPPAVGHSPSRLPPHATPHGAATLIAADYADYAPLV